jgi:hypothetical protein
MQPFSEFEYRGSTKSDTMAVRERMKKADLNLEFLFILKECFTKYWTSSFLLTRPESPDPT